MNDINTIEKIENYLLHKMSATEKEAFEQQRKENVELDQAVVEHDMFLQRVKNLHDRKSFQAKLQHIHDDLVKKNAIKTISTGNKSKLIYLWERYKKVTAVAALIACVTTIGFVWIYSSVSSFENPSVKELVNRVNFLDNKTAQLDNKITEVDKKKHRAAFDIPIRFNGTGFLIANDGIMVTNAHVVKNSSNIYVQDAKGKKFTAEVVKLDIPHDLAIIQIIDSNFVASKYLPYGLSKANSELAEPIYTLGYPKNEIVFNEGYVSAKNGFNGDTLRYQISIAANPGNSGGPVFNQRGEVIGILSGKETQTESVVFAVRTKYIYQAIKELKEEDKDFKKLILSNKSSISNLSKINQVKQAKNYVFMVKGT